MMQKRIYLIKIFGLLLLAAMIFLLVSCYKKDEAVDFGPIEQIEVENIVKNEEIIWGDYKEDSYTKNHVQWYNAFSDWFGPMSKEKVSEPLMKKINESDNDAYILVNVRVSHKNKVTRYGYYAEIDAEVLKDDKSPDAYDDIVLEYISKYNEAYKKSKETLQGLFDNGTFVYDAFTDDKYTEQLSVMAGYLEKISDRLDEILAEKQAKGKDTYYFESTILNFKDDITVKQTESAAELMEKFGFAPYDKPDNNIGKGIYYYITKVKEIKRISSFEGKELPFSFGIDLFREKKEYNEIHSTVDEAPVGVDSAEMSMNDVIRSSRGEVNSLEIWPVDSSICPLGLLQRSIWYWNEDDVAAVNIQGLITKVVGGYRSEIDNIKDAWKEDKKLIELIENYNREIRKSEEIIKQLMDSGRSAFSAYNDGSYIEQFKKVGEVASVLSEYSRSCSATNYCSIGGGSGEKVKEMLELFGFEAYSPISLSSPMVGSTQVNDSGAYVYLANVKDLRRFIVEMNDFYCSRYYIGMGTVVSK